MRRRTKQSGFDFFASSRLRGVTFLDRLTKPVEHLARNSPRSRPTEANVRLARPVKIAAASGDKVEPLCEREEFFDQYLAMIGVNRLDAGQAVVGQFLHHVFELA